MGHVVRIAGEPDGEVGTDCLQGGEFVRVTTGGDDRSRPEVLGDLDGQPSGGTGGTENQHRLSRFENDPAFQGHPRRHGRIHGCGQEHRVGVGREWYGAAPVDDGVLSHRAERGVKEDEVHVGPVGATPHAVDARDKRQPAVGRIVRTVGLGAHAGVQAGCEDVDQLFVFARRNGRGELLVAGRLAEVADDGCVHRDGPFTAVVGRPS